MNKKSLQKFIEWLIYMIGYALILISVSVLFKKPIIVKLTIPITALTLGVFYPFINVFILYIVDFCLGSHFSVNGIFMTCLVAILISIMNMILDNVVIKPLLRKD